LSQNEDDEMILAQEQGVINKDPHLTKKGDIEGTLVLTNRQLIFVSNDNHDESMVKSISSGQPLDNKIAQESADLGEDVFGSSAPQTYVDIEDLSTLSRNLKNLFIPIRSIVSSSGHRGVFGRPNLKISWTGSSGEGEITNIEFQETLTERDRKKSLADWAGIIQRLKDGTLSPHKPINLPQRDSIEGRIYTILGDMQTKGSIQLEEEAEKRFGIELEPEEVETAFGNLVSLGLVERIADPSGDSFYKMRSPLGEDDLST
jgi:hypothetical protein